MPRQQLQRCSALVAGCRGWLRICVCGFFQRKPLCNRSTADWAPHRQREDIASKTSSSAPGEGSMVQTPRCTARRPAQPSGAARRRHAGHGDGRGAAPGPAGLRTSARQPQRQKRTSNAVCPAPAPARLACGGGRWLRQLRPGLEHRLGGCRRDGQTTPRWHRSREPQGHWQATVVAPPGPPAQPPRARLGSKPGRPQTHAVPAAPCAGMRWHGRHTGRPPRSGTPLSPTPTTCQGERQTETPPQGQVQLATACRACHSQFFAMVDVVELLQKINRRAVCNQKTCTMQ